MKLLIVAVLCLGAVSAQRNDGTLLECKFSPNDEFCTNALTYVGYDVNRNTLNWRELFLRSDQGTQSQGTGPDGPTDGFYGYLEATQRTPGDTLTIEMSTSVTPQLACLSLSYQMFDEDSGELGYLLIQAGSFFKNISGHQGRGWQVLRETIQDFDRVRLTLVRGRAYRGDIALDNLLVKSGDCQGRPAPTLTTTTTRRPYIPDDRAPVPVRPGPGPRPDRPRPDTPSFPPNSNQNSRPRPQPDFGSQNDVLNSRSQTDGRNEDRMESMAAMEEMKAMKGMKEFLGNLKKIDKFREMKDIPWEMCEKMAYPFTIALVGGQNATYGRVQIMYKDMQGSVCNDGFTDYEAKAVCKSLGMFGGRILMGSEVPFDARLNRNDPTPILMDDVRCYKGNYLQECCRNEMGVNNCTHDNDVFIACNPLPEFCGFLTNKTKMGKMGRNMGCAKMPDDMDMEDDEEGYSMMGNMMGDMMGDMDKMKKKMFMKMARELMPMCMSNEHFTVGLAGGDNATTGLLRIRYGNEWGTVCNHSFTEKEARAACKSMGFFGGEVLMNPPERTRLRDTRLPIWLDGLRCPEGAFLQECCRNAMGVSDCTHGRDVYLKCEPWHEQCQEMKEEYDEKKEKMKKHAEVAECMGMSPEELKKMLMEAKEEMMEMMEMKEKKEKMEKMEKMKMMMKMMGMEEEHIEKAMKFMKVMKMMKMMGEGEDEDDMGGKDKDMMMMVKMMKKLMMGGMMGGYEDEEDDYDMGGGRGKGGMGGGRGMGGGMKGGMKGGMDGPDPMMMAMMSMMKMGGPPKSGMGGMGGRGGPPMGGMGGGMGDPMQFLQMLMKMMEMQKGMNRCGGKEGGDGGDSSPTGRPPMNNDRVGG